VPIVSTGGAARTLAQRLPLIDRDLTDDFDYVSLLIDVRERRFARPEEQPNIITDRFWRS
jgi:hypothetical protein